MTVGAGMRRRPAERRSAVMEKLVVISALSAGRCKCLRGMAHDCLGARARPERLPFDTRAARKSPPRLIDRKLCCAKFPFMIFDGAIVSNAGAHYNALQELRQRLCAMKFIAFPLLSALRRLARSDNLFSEIYSLNVRDIDV